MKFFVVYQDYREGPMYTFSEHRSEKAAQKALKKALADPFWRRSGYIFSVQCTKRPVSRLCSDLREYL